MKTKFTWLGIVAAILLSVSAFFIACDKDLNSVVKYQGQVVYINTTTPFPDLTVKVTNGKETHCQTQTDAGGAFELKVRISEIDNNYYLLAGDSTCVPKKVNLGGFGQAEVDLGVIEVEGPALPTVVTDTTVRSVSANAAILGGEVQTDGRLSVTARGICYGKETYPTIDGLHTIDGTGLGSFTSNLKDLEYKTIYYARAYATNKKGTAYGEQVKFTTEEGVPLVYTDSVIRITAHTAKCKGHVESDGGFPVTKRGTCWSKHPDPTVDDDCTDDGSGLGEFTSSLKDLEENTAYHVRTYATNSTATVYGEDIIITTLDGLAVLTTDSITSITATGFTAYGTVVSDCDIPVTARGFCYSTKQYPTIEDKYITVSKGLGSFRGTINDLQYGTTYYVRAYATNETATTYGEQKEVITLSGLPTVTTNEVTNISSVRATCGGNVTDDGTLIVTARGVCYGTESQPTVEGLHTTNGKGTGAFTSHLTDLKDKTTYYVRAYATTDAGTAYGKEYKFKTEDGVPIVVLSEVGEPTANSVSCKGNVTGDGGVDVTERGFCYSTSQYPTNTSDHVAIGKGIGEFSGSITGLALNTKYYVRAYAVNSLGIGYSKQLSFTTKDGLATVTTSEPTATATTIIASGDITDNCGYAVTERGVCYSQVNSEPTITDKKVQSGKGNGAFSVTISELSMGTKYYVRAYATNENGTAYGEAVTIQTKDGNASVTFGQISNITALSASTTVTVSDAGGATLQSCGICWSTQPNPTIENSKAVASGKALNAAYTCNIAELQPNITYYVRAYATTDVTTAYSEQKSFKTKDGNATVTLGQISNITALSATTTVTVADAGGSTLQSCGICWSTQPNPTTEDSKVVVGGKSLNAAYTCGMTGLQPNTKYYVRAFATTDINTAYSESKTFTTTIGLAVLSAVTTTTTATSITCSSEVTDNGGYNVTERGICYSITNAEPTILDVKLASGSGNGKFNVTVTELAPSTSYYVRAYATNSNGTNYSKVVSVTTKNGVATVTTGAISNVTALSATGQVTVTDAGGASLQSCGICWSTNPNPTIEDNKVVASGKTINTAYSCNLSNLTPNTRYYVRAYAVTDFATSYGEQQNFQTQDGRPQLTTMMATATSTTISSGGSITSDGGYNILSRGLCYSTTNAEPTINDAYTTNGSGIGSFTATITNVTVSTTYYVRAYATNNIGTGYGNVVTVTTGDGLPSVTTTVIGENVTETTAIGGGNVTDDGGYLVTARGVCWSIVPNPTTSDSKTTDGGGLGYFTSNITGINLNSGYTYYVRAYATNANGTVYGKSVTINKENLDYAQLPTAQYGGYTYKLYPDMGKMTWEAAISACNNLSYGGYDDWYLPSINELQACYGSTYNMDGWKVDLEDTSYGFYEFKGTYWSSEDYSRDENYAQVFIINITVYSGDNSRSSNIQTGISNKYTSSERVRPVRKYIAQ